MKKLLAILSLVIFSFQVLPVKELGKVLYKGLLTEEVSDSGAEECPGSFGKTGNAEDFCNYNTDYLIPGTRYHSVIAIMTVQRSLLYQLQFFPETETPPPDGQC